jgi:aspartyl-tRNA(Asn)/glutamyl-tRNA(Gln) amidotransferase subunit B
MTNPLQVSLIRAGRGHEIIQETRLWDEFKLVTATMRKKEGLADYRYFPEPDLPPLVLSDSLLSSVKASINLHTLDLFPALMATFLAA